MLQTFQREVFRFAIPKGLISATFATGVISKPRPAKLAYANRPWELEECDIALQHAPPHVKVVLAVLMTTGLDPGASGASPPSKWPFPSAPRCRRP
jgi:hypothetical protein